MKKIAILTFVLTLIVYSNSFSQQKHTPMLSEYNKSIEPGVNEMTGENKTLTIYPNPANSKITISYELSGNKDVNISIYDLVGKLIYSEITTSKNSDIDISNLINGVYYVKITDNDFIATKKLVVKH